MAISNSYVKLPEGTMGIMVFWARSFGHWMNLRRSEHLIEPLDAETAFSAFQGEKVVYLI